MGGKPTTKTTIHVDDGDGDISSSGERGRRGMRRRREEGTMATTTTTNNTRIKRQRRRTTGRGSGVHSAGDGRRLHIRLRHHPPFLIVESLSISKPPPG
jgi:hypothetical protein